MSRTSLKVSLSGEPQKALSGDFAGSIWRSRSWWMLEEQGLLVIHLYKRDLAAWKQLFDTPTLSVYRRQAYPWTTAMAEYGTAHNTPGYGTVIPQDIPQEEDLVVLPPGRPELDEGEPLTCFGFGIDEALGRTNTTYSPVIQGGVFAPRSAQYICSPDSLFLGITFSQDAHHVTIQAHFERNAFEDVKQRFPLEALLATDITESSITIFLQGDKQNPVFVGELWGKCVEQDSTWRITSSEGMRTRQESPSMYSPALEIKLKKAADASCPSPWEEVFTECFHHRLMAKRASEGGAVERFEGPAGSKTYIRSGYKLDDLDFWSHVHHYVRETMKKSGYTSQPQPLRQEQLPVST